jgi:hypothetical protein
MDIQKEKMHLFMDVKMKRSNNKIVNIATVTVIAPIQNKVDYFHLCYHFSTKILSTNHAILQYKKIKKVQLVFNYGNNIKFRIYLLYKYLFVHLNILNIIFAQLITPTLG